MRYVLLVLIVLAGCDIPPRIERTKKAGPTLSNIEYDGHTFIYSVSNYGDGSEGQLLHHPDCKCQK